MSKTLEQYSTIAKLLKLDILRVKIVNDELKQKLGIPVKPLNQPQSHIDGAGTDQLAQTWRQMRNFSKALQSIGITPEMYFRLCDEKKRKAISVQQFVEKSRIMNLGLEKKGLELIGLRCDQKKNGNIEYDYYRLMMEAFQIATEKSLRKVGLFDSALQKIAQLWRQGLLAALDSEKPLYFNEFQFLVAKEFKSMSQPELISIYLHLDAGRQFRIPGQLFYRQVKELGSKHGKQKENVKEKPSRKESADTIKSEIKNKLGGESERKSKNIFQNTETEPKKEEESKQTEQRAQISDKEVQDLMLKKGLDSLKALSQLLRIDEEEGTLPLQRAYTVKQFREAYWKCSKQAMSKHQLMQIFRKIDQKERGSINAEDLIRFYRSDSKCTKLLVAYCLGSSTEQIESNLKSQIKDTNSISLDNLLAVLRPLSLEDKQIQTLYQQLKGKNKTVTLGQLTQTLGQSLSKLKRQRKEDH